MAGWCIGSAAVDPRLRPLNAVLALLHPDGAWFHDLAGQGFRPHSIELKVLSSAGIVVADAVLYRLNPDLVLLDDAPRLAAEDAIRDARRNSCARGVHADTANEQGA
jgi:hypothetical protein